MEKRLKVIIDTDIGDDIDDAFALLFAMKLGFDIVGITTVFGNTEQRARITKKLLKLYGNGYENVPVFAGCATPLASEKKDFPTLLCQYTPDIDAEDYKPDSSDENDAIDFIIDSCKKYGKELTVIAIGPFTNIARVIEKDPDALGLAKEVVIMGGAFYKQYSDWNVICDVEAADVMFRNLHGIKCLGADVTHKLVIDASDDRRILEANGNEAVKYVSDIYSKWKAASGKSSGILHDPLAIYYAQNNAVCECESAPVAVITDGYSRGFTLNVKAYTKAAFNSAYRDFDFERTHILAKTVDRELIVSDFMKCFE